MQRKNAATKGNRSKGKMLQIVNTTANMKCFKLNPENIFAQGH